MTFSERRGKVRFCGTLAALATTLALVCCGDKSGPTVGSETHFLSLCDDACPDGTECLCGVCTASCSEARQCADLQPNATCATSAPRIAEGRCPAMDQPAFCDLPCLVDRDCASMGDDYGCQGGYCRGGSTADPARTGATPSSACQPEPPPANELLVLGDSLIELSSFTSSLEQHALDSQVLAQDEHFRVHASSLMSFLAEGSLSILAQYATARQEGHARVVVMDGGETDMFGGLCDSEPKYDCPAVRGAANGAKKLLQQMVDDGVEHVVYFFYPDPVGNPDMLTNLNVLRPVIENVCGQSSLACHWVDLRPPFAGQSDYLGSDGLMFTDAGASAAATAVWQRMQARCIVP
jgi:hypothetical protein